MRRHRQKRGGAESDTEQEAGRQKAEKRTSTAYRSPATSTHLATVTFRHDAATRVSRERWRLTRTERNQRRRGRRLVKRRGRLSAPVRHSTDVSMHFIKFLVFHLLSA